MQLDPEVHARGKRDLFWLLGTGGKPGLPGKQHKRLFSLVLSSVSPWSGTNGSLVLACIPPLMRSSLPWFLEVLWRKLTGQGLGVLELMVMMEESI